MATAEQTAKDAKDAKAAKDYKGRKGRKKTKTCHPEERQRRGILGAIVVARPTMSTFEKIPR